MSNNSCYICLYIASINCNNNYGTLFCNHSYYCVYRWGCVGARVCFIYLFLFWNNKSSEGKARRFRRVRWVKQTSNLLFSTRTIGEVTTRDYQDSLLSVKEKFHICLRKGSLAFTAVTWSAVQKENKKRNNFLASSKSFITYFLIS